MLTATYDVLEDDEACPFDGTCNPASREMTSNIAMRGGVRFDRAVLIDGTSARLNWLWPGKIPLGRVTLLEGPAGAGKSFVALDLVSRLCDDRPWPDGAPQSRQGPKALILCRQDDPCSIVGARLEAMGADPERCAQFLEFETADEEGAPPGARLPNRGHADRLGQRTDRSTPSAPQRERVRPIVAGTASGRKPAGHGDQTVGEGVRFLGRSGAPGQRQTQRPKNEDHESTKDGQHETRRIA